MDVSVSQQHINTGNVVDSLEEAVELQEAARAVPLQSEATVFCLELMKIMNRNAYQLVFPLWIQCNNHIHEHAEFLNLLQSDACHHLCLCTGLALCHCSTCACIQIDCCQHHLITLQYFSVMCFVVCICTMFPEHVMSY